MNTLSSLLEFIGYRIGNVGVIEMYAGSTPPKGWMKCDGSAIKRAEYPDLFTAIGTTYGVGDGSTTFNLPDLRDRFAVGAGTTYSLNDKGGSATVSLTDDEMAHGHSFTQPTISGRGLSFAEDEIGIELSTIKVKTDNVTGAEIHYPDTAGTRESGYIAAFGDAIVPETHTHTASGGAVANLGSSRTAHENRPPYIGVNFIICVGKKVVS